MPHHRAYQWDSRDEAVLMQLKWLRIVTAIFAVLLFAVSFKLWTQDGSLYPQVPMFGFLRNVTRFVDVSLFGLGGMWLLLLIVVGDRRWSVIAIMGFLLCAVGLVALDQHRLQPWLQQIVILFLGLAVLSPTRFVRFARLLFVSIYFFSATSKFDYVFLNTLGQQFVEQLGMFAGVDFLRISPQARVVCALVFPLCELLIAIGLFWSKTRRWAAYAAVSLHIALVVILGPYGLDHHSGVLCWNGCFVAQIIILFLWKRDEGRVLPESPQPPKWSTMVCSALVLLPAAEPFGVIDHWPAWQLYAPRNSRTTLFILDPRLSELPKDLRRFVDSGSDGRSLYRRFDLDAWSLETLNVPVYPQDRFQLGVCLGVAKQFELAGGVRVDMQSVSNRWNGQRKTRSFYGTSEATEAAEISFRLNALPRRWNPRTE